LNPSWWFVELSPVCQQDRIWKLRGCQIADANTANEARYTAQPRIWIGDGRKQPDRLAKELRYDANRLDQIAVIGKHGRDVISILERVKEQVTRQVHIASL